MSSAWSPNPPSVLNSLQELFRCSSLLVFESYFSAYRVTVFSFYLGVALTTKRGPCSPSPLPKNQKKKKKKKKEKNEMGSRLGRRVVNFANLPIKLLMPSSFSNITEISLKTIPSASKIEIKRVLESLYGFEVEKVRTLNRDGKKKKAGGILLKKPDYKKAYVTLKSPLSISTDLYPIKIIEEDKMSLIKESKTKSKSWRTAGND
ncbi:hypothetical protein Vadar_013282 [Vaccinium darrowii]|uniref:Uncharacterized protein n=1 Tax=Vaccinium darrowii TaxID=229202 RepID=A0ACB7YDW7_9ERIC|nr:hypothetical protein Vadar_013282 [Vaccinium darrowii]